MKLHCTICLLALTIASSIMAQDVVSGPEKGKKVPELKVFSFTGPVQGDTVDYAEKRKELPTIYVVIPAKKFDRPIFSFLKGLETAVEKNVKDGLVIAVWLTEDEQKTKDYMPKITKYFQHAALTYFPGDKAGPKDWFINDQADLTVILAPKGTVADRFGYNAINDTVVKDVMKAFSKAAKEK